MEASTAPAVAPRRRWRVPGVAESTSGRIGLAMIAIVLGVTILGPIFASYPADQPIGLPGLPPTGPALLGTDQVGRDVLSRTLDGGVSVIVLGTSAIAIAYLLALAVGITAGLHRSIVDSGLMRLVDVLLSIPPLLLLLVLVAGGGHTSIVIIVGVGLVLFPGAARIIRAATLEVSTTGYLEAAIGRGESTLALMRREVLPNIMHVVLADFGIRYSAAIILVASLNFLGVGVRPPTADWALMITENRQILSSNPWGVIAPVLMLGMLSLGVNLTADAYARSLGRSRGSR
jgi:peptide/nickel transport system permease protein